MMKAQNRLAPSRFQSVNVLLGATFFVVGCTGTGQRSPAQPRSSISIHVEPTLPSELSLPAPAAREDGDSDNSRVDTAEANVSIAEAPVVSLASTTTRTHSPAPIIVTAAEPPMPRDGENPLPVEQPFAKPIAAYVDSTFHTDASSTMNQVSEAIENPASPFPSTAFALATPESSRTASPSSASAVVDGGTRSSASTEQLITMQTALELAAGQNPQVAYANEKIRESFARWDAARALWLPSLRAGANYHKHEGRIQDVAGTIIETSRNSVYNGFGAQAVGAGSPAVPGLLVNFHLRDGLYQPRIAGQIVGANRQASRAISNDILLDTALAYIDLLEASQLRAIAGETQTNAEHLATLTQQFATVGEGLQADADRAATELAIRRFEVQKATEQTRVQSVRLARLLSQDPTLYLAPAEPALAPIELTEKSSDVSSLVAQGLATRPELAEHQYLVGEAIERLRREKVAPLVPSVLLGLSYGGNGGGLGSSFQNYGDRMDFDAAAFWEVRNLGYGEHAARCEAQSRVRQARYRQVQVLDRVASEIVEAKTQLDAKQSQLELAQAAIATARDSYRRNSERIAAGQGMPMEAQQSIAALDQAQRLYANTVAEYNRAQFRLQRALGFPATAL